MEIYQLPYDTGHQGWLQRLKSFIIRHQRLLFPAAAFCGLLGVLPFVFLGGHQLVEVVDSTSFCTEVCHDVHYAEAVTFQESPHSEVTCANCHVGSGAGNLVRSKLRGLSDIIPAIIGKYERPIATPLEDRRPSSETCEKCHSSEKFFGDVPRIKTSYDTDPLNTKSTVTRVLKVGGGKRAVAAGIHWHATAGLWYLTADSQRLKMAWVATRDESGEVVEYIDPDLIGGVTPERIQQDKRLMDCMDCHNRATHLFRSPDDLINTALSEGRIDVNIPFIKREALNALVPQNASLGEAYDKVAKIGDFYRSDYPELYQAKKSSIDASLNQLRNIARLTTFPDNLNWNTYPDHALHDKPDIEMNVDFASISTADSSPGCFRCHGNLAKVAGDGATDLVQVLNGATFSKGAGSIKLSAGNPVHATPSSAGSSAATEALRLDADCNSCHYTLKSPITSPIAPATSHPIDGLDKCLVCHSESSARPFKSDHPWSTEAACNSCHQSAPKLKRIPFANPPEAKPITHSVSKLKDCLACHGLSSAEPISKEHPWATNDTCDACHESAAKLKPFPSPTPPPDAKPTSHSINKLEDCVTCHGPSAVKAISKDHPWTTNDTCVACHEAAPKPKPFPSPTPQKDAKPITHSLNKLENCLSCHGTSSPRPFAADHPWATNDTCSACHKVSPVLSSVTPTTVPIGTPVRHSLAGLGTCLSCHRQGGLARFPADHVGRPDSLCTICHQTVGGTLEQQPVTPPPPSPPPPPVSHQLDTAHTGCVTCHGPSGVRPFGSDHTGRTNQVCLLCHKPGAPAPPTTQAPAAPVSLAALAVSPTQVNLAWADISSDETGFRVERATDNNFTTGLVTAIVVANTTTYSDTAASASTTYYYRVFAYNTSGDSVASNTASVTTPNPPTTPPSTPTSLAASAVSPAQVNLTWTDNAASETGYRVERATNSAFTAGKITVNAAANATSYNDTTAVASTTYYYRVFAYNSVGDSGATNIVSVTMPNPPASPPVAPTNLSALPVSPTQVNLTWTDNAGNETGFRIERATNSAFTTGLVTASVAVANAISYSDSTVAASTTYYYRASAYNAAGSSPASNTVSVTTPAPAINASALYSANCAACHGANRQGGSASALTANALSSRALSQVTGIITGGTSGMPGYSSTLSSAEISALASWLKNAAPTAPAGLKAIAVSPAQVNLAWADNSSDESGFRVERSNDNNFTTGLVTATLGANATSYSDTAVSAATRYYYRVFAYNAAGDSDPCIDSVTTPDPSASPPVAPTSLSALPLNPTQVNLSWVDNASTETGYRVERATNSAFTTVVTAALGANVTAYSDTTVSGSTTYYYRVFAGNDSGDSTASNTASVTTPASTATIPSAPTSLAATAISAVRVNLSWVDNASNETGYRIDRAVNSSFTTGLVTVNIAAAGTVSYSDTTVAGSSTYYYRVFAVNSAGNSAASNTVSTTTPAVTAAVLYSNSCASCHGASGQGTISGPAVAGAAATTTTKIVRTGTSTMPAYSTTQISSTALTSLAGYVTGLSPTPTTGSTIYALNCAVCHGTTGRGTTLAPHLAGVPASITNSITRSGLGTTMPAYSTADISSTNLSTLATYIAAMGPPPSDGWGVYAEYCVTCHGIRGQGGSGGRIAGDSTSSTSSAVREGPDSMPAYTTTQISNTSLANLATYVNRLGTATTIPAAPTSLTDTVVSAAQVNLAWVDNATTETAYRVERATNSYFSANLVATALAAGARSYNDTTVSSATIYYYRVFAYNPAGYSAASNSVSATIP